MAWNLAGIKNKKIPGIKINPDVNVENWLIKEYVIKDFLESR